MADLDQWIIAITIPALKIGGVLLAGASIIGERRLTRFETRTRRFLRWDSIRLWSSRLLEERVAWPLFIGLVFTIGIIGRLANLLIDQWIAQKWIANEANLFSLIIARLAITSAVILVAWLSLLALAGILNMVGVIDEEKWTLQTFATKLYGWVREFTFTAAVLTVVSGPFLLLIALSHFLSQGIVFVLRNALSILTWLLSRPFVWLDRQVQQRRLESTLVVAGLLMAIAGEVLDRFVK